jgi:hypothetical protein
MNELRHIIHENINRVLWDKCVSRAFNGDVFGFSWFLDAVFDRWDALIIDDYKAVMPIPVYIKKRFRKIAQKIIPIKFNLYFNVHIETKIKDIDLNFTVLFKTINVIKTENKELFSNEMRFKKHKSFHMDLINSYDSLKHTYSDFVKKQIKISEENKIFYNIGILPNGIALLASISDKLNKKQQNLIRKITAVSLRKFKGEIYGAFNDKNRLIATAFFLNSHFKTYLITSYQTKESINKRALFGLIDYYLKTHSELALTLDFFGLNAMPDEFYLGIGAVEYPYYTYRKRFYL